MPYLLAEGLCKPFKQSFLIAGIFRTATFRGDFRIEVAIGAETSAERYVDIYHDLAKYEFCCTKKRLGRIGLNSIDSLVVNSYAVEINTHVHLGSLIVNLTGS